MSNAHWMKLVLPALSSPTMAIVTSGRGVFKGSCRRRTAVSNHNGLLKLQGVQGCQGSPGLSSLMHFQG